MRVRAPLPHTPHTHVHALARVRTYKDTIRDSCAHACSRITHALSVLHQRGGGGGGSFLAQKINKEYFSSIFSFTEK